MRLLIFSPFSNIWVHSMPEALIGASARRSGMEVAYVTCGGLLQRSHCVAMDEVGLDARATSSTRKAVCDSCAQRARTLTSSLSLELSDLASYADTADEAWVSEVSAAATPSTWTDLEVDGIPIGRYAAYEFFLKFKLNSLGIPVDLWDLYIGQLQNALRVYRACERLLETMRPDRAVVYNTLYSVNRVFMALAEQRGVPCFTMQGGNHPTYRGETLTIFKSDLAAFRSPRSTAWRLWASGPIGDDDVQLVVDAVRAQFRATSPFVYSKPHAPVAPTQIREALGIREDAKVALAILSSRDEIFAADVVGRFDRPVDGTFLFEQQSDWVAHLVEIAARRPDLHFVIRVHPREFPNKREAVLSPNAKRLQGILTGLPANVSVDWPHAGRSLPSVLQIADVVLSGWSSVGFDAALLGIPSVIYDTGEVLGYPVELADLVMNVEEYEGVLDRALEAGWSLERARMAFRWGAFNYGRLSVDLSDQIPSRSRWSARRVAQGVYAHTRVPLPFGIVRALEQRELPAMADALAVDSIVEDVLVNERESVADSPAWPLRPNGDLSVETRLVALALLEIAALFGAFPDDPRCVSSRISHGTREALAAS
jgi:hypothetical protein